MKRLLVLIYGSVCYLFFLGTFLYAIGFVCNIYVPKSIDSGIEGATIESIIINLLLLSLFAIQHAVMARPRFKSVLTKIIPAAAERSTFVLMSNIVLCLLFWQWQPTQGILWHATDPTGILVLNVICGIGWLIVLVSTFLIDHFDLFGLKQVIFYFLKKEMPDQEFSKKGFYKWVRHPLMAGFLIAFWATPTMTYGHLLFAIGTTGFIFIDVIFFEETDLKIQFGEMYKQYIKDVPMVIPFTKFKKK